MHGTSNDATYGGVFGFAMYLSQLTGIAHLLAGLDRVDVRVPRMSEAWLRQHEVDEAKRRDAGNTF